MSRISDEMVEAAARAMHAKFEIEGGSWEREFAPVRNKWMDRARAALEAAFAQGEAVEPVAWEVRDAAGNWKWCPADKGCYQMVKRHRPNDARALYEHPQPAPQSEPAAADVGIPVSASDAELSASIVQIMNAKYDGLGRLPADVIGVLNCAAESLAARQTEVQ